MPSLVSNVLCFNPVYNNYILYIVEGGGTHSGKRELGGQKIREEGIGPPKFRESGIQGRGNWALKI